MHGRWAATTLHCLFRLVGSVTVGSLAKKRASQTNSLIILLRLSRCLRCSCGPVTEHGNRRICHNTSLFMNRTLSSKALTCESPQLVNCLILLSKAIGFGLYLPVSRCQYHLLIIDGLFHHFTFLVRCTLQSPPSGRFVRRLICISMYTIEL